MVWTVLPCALLPKMPRHEGRCRPGSTLARGGGASRTFLVPVLIQELLPDFRKIFMQPIIIIGAGLAAYTFAREFRKLDKATPLVLITADDGGFYSKPMLSNALAQRQEPA